ncbi:MAG: dihydrofolate reductase family protein [Phyllobacterium sp.]
MNDIIYMFAMSLDGFIANEDGSFDWLNDFPANADFSFDTFMESVTGIIMGRDTYEVIRSEPTWPYPNIPSVVATRRPLDGLPDNTSHISGTPQEMLDAVRGMGASGRIWIMGGGNVAKQFLDAGLLDTVEIGTIPVILGKGIPAFGKSSQHWLELQFAKALKNGAVHSQYRVKR